MDYFFLLFAFILGGICYALWIHFKPGMQPGEAQINALLAHFPALTAALNANTVATQQAASAPLPPPVYQPLATSTTVGGSNTLPQNTLPQRAAAEINALVAGAQSPTPTPEQTITEFALSHGVRASDLPGFISYAMNMPGQLTYADILLAWNKANAERDANLAAVGAQFSPAPPRAA